MKVKWKGMVASIQWISALGERARSFCFKMGSDLGSEISLLSSDSLETVVNNIAILNKKIHITMVRFIRIAIGSTHGLNFE